jgi:hypothetical protein
MFLGSLSPPHHSPFCKEGRGRSFGSSNGIDKKTLDRKNADIGSSNICRGTKDTSFHPSLPTLIASR